jgi:hypothetical protein
MCGLRRRRLWLGAVHRLALAADGAQRLWRVRHSQRLVGSCPACAPVATVACAQRDCNQRNWAVITAGQNFVETAEAALGGNADPAQVRAVHVLQRQQQRGRPHASSGQIQEPSSSATQAEIAWHFFLARWPRTRTRIACLSSPALR